MASDSTDPPIAGELNFKKSSIFSFKMTLLYRWWRVSSSIRRRWWWTTYWRRGTIRKWWRWWTGWSRSGTDRLSSFNQPLFISLTRVRICLWKNYWNYMVKMLHRPIRSLQTRMKCAFICSRKKVSTFSSFSPILLLRRTRKWRIVDNDFIIYFKSMGSYCRKTRMVMRRMIRSNRRLSRFDLVFCWSVLH